MHASLLLVVIFSQTDSAWEQSLMSAFCLEPYSYFPENSHIMGLHSIIAIAAFATLRFAGQRLNDSDGGSSPAILTVPAISPFIFHDDAKP
jgi:hypothetical protein